RFSPGAVSVNLGSLSQPTSDDNLPARGSAPRCSLMALRAAAGSLPGTRALTPAKPSGLDEANTAAHTRRVRRNTFQKTHAAAVPSPSFDSGNTAASAPAQSRHRSGTPVAAHTQKASRNLRS